MQLEHHKWNKTGRTYKVLNDQGQPTGQFCWGGGLGEKSVFHNNEYHPYIWKDTTKELLHGEDNAIEFASGEQIVKRLGKKLINSSKLFVQRKVGADWVNAPHGLPTRTIRHNEVYKKGIGWVSAEGKCTGFLNFPDAQYDLQVGISAGRSNKVTLGYRFRSPVAATVRMQWVLDGLEKLPQDYEWIYSYAGPGKTTEEFKKKVGIRFKNIEFRWTYAEADQRSFAHETNPDGTHKLTITFGPYDVLADEWHEIMPDTWGATAVAADDDDCQESLDNTLYDTSDTSQYDSGKIYLDDGDPGQEKWLGFRWVPDLGGGAISAIGPGSEIVLKYAGDNNLGADADFYVWGSDIGDTSQWATTNKPSGVGKTTQDSEDGLIPGLTADKTIGVDDIIEELCVTDGHTYNASEGMSFICEATHGLGWNRYWDVYDEGHATGAPCTLYIVYTLAGVGVAPTSVLYGPLVGPMGGPI